MELVVLPQGRRVGVWTVTSSIGGTTRTHTRTHTQVRARTQTHTHAQAHTSTNTHTHAHTQTHTHTVRAAGVDPEGAAGGDEHWPGRPRQLCGLFAGRAEGVEAGGSASRQAGLPLGWGPPARTAPCV